MDFALLETCYGANLTFPTINGSGTTLAALINALTLGWFAKSDSRAPTNSAKKVYVPLFKQRL